MTSNEDINDDELDRIQLPPKPTNPSAAHPDGTAADDSATTPTSNLRSWDADGDDDIAAQVLRRAGVEYLKVIEGNPTRISLVPGSKIVGGQAHYDSIGKRYYLCGSTKNKQAACCRKFGDPKGRCSGYVFRYLNADAKTAKLDPNATPEVDVQIFTMSYGNWQDLKNGVEEGASVYDVDFKVSVAEKQLQRKITVISRSPRWKQIEQQALEMAAPIIADERQLRRAIGREFGDVNNKASLADIEEEM